MLSHMVLTRKNVVDCEPVTKYETRCIISHCHQQLLDERITENINEKLIEDEFVCKSEFGKKTWLTPSSYILCYVVLV